MKQSYIIARDRALTVDELRKAIPAAFAHRPWERTSAKYRHVPTVEIIGALENVGYLPHSARQGGTRIPGKEFHIRHLITFKRESDHYDSLTPTVWVLNSSDLSTDYRMGIGLFRAECLNHFLCTLAENYSAFRVRHVLKTSVESIIAEVQQLASAFPGLLKTVERFKATQLSDPHRLQFAESALALRYSKGDSAPYVADRLLQVRRFADQGRDLFSTLNVVQENLTQTTHARYNSEKTSRKVGLVRDMELNKGLWELASSYSIN